MNYKGFKKVHEDDHSATLEHPRGHKVVVAKSGLSGKLKKDLAALPIHAADGALIEPLSINLNSPNMAGAEVKKDDFNPPEDRQEKPNVDLQKYMSQIPNLPGIDKEKLAQEFITKQEGAAESPQFAPQKAKTEGIKLANYPVSPEGQQAPQAGFANSMMQMNALQAGALGQGFAERERGLGMEARAMAQQADLEKQAAQEHEQQLATIQNNLASETKRLNDERQNLLKDYQAGHINPDHYMESKGAGQKIAMAIGLIAGGIGAGIGKTQNIAAEFLNKQIERDIDAQKANLGKTQTLLSANMQEFGNMRDAVQMTTAMQKDIYATKLKEAAAKVMDPMAKARLMQQAGQLHVEASQMIGPLALKTAMLSGVKSGNVSPRYMVEALVPKEHQAKAFEEVKDMQNMTASRDNALNAFDKVSQLQSVSSRVGSPIQSKQQIDALVKPLIANLSKETAGRFTETDAHFLETLMPSLRDDAQTIAVKRNRLSQLYQEKMNYPIIGDLIPVRAPKPSPLGIVPASYKGK